VPSIVEALRSLRAASVTIDGEARGLRSASSRTSTRSAPHWLAGEGAPGAFL
jgi:hypothetical protein